MGGGVFWLHLVYPFNSLFSRTMWIIRHHKVNHSWF